MPVVLRIKGYRFWFYSANLNQPPHIHAGTSGISHAMWKILEFGMVQISLTLLRATKPKVSS